MMKKTVAFAALGSALLVVSTAFAQTPGFSGPEIWAGKCIYITGKSVKTHAPCSIKVYANAFSATEVWEWENGTRTVVKEVQFRPKIGASDFEVKRKRVVRFLQDNDKVKVTMRFRGREVTHPEIGNEILNRLRDSVADYGEIETAARLEGRQMTMVLAPVRSSDRPVEEIETADLDDVVVEEADE